MSDEISAERIKVIAAAAGVAIDAMEAARIARSVAPTITRFRTENVSLPLEVEPATYVTVVTGEGAR